ncbi:MAG TPA: DUF362 domain-containing protein [Methanocella sp.]|jgi:uncharacterized protein (DUF362 family)/NAD-dependent dihydropyrimidine dehydrogenase PreA subunit
MMGDGTGVKIVSMTKCDDYEREKVVAAVRRSIDLIGGVGAFVSPGQKVFVKFNLLLGSAPETCVTTHPEVVYAVAKLLKAHGCDVLLGDSPGSGLLYTEAALRKAYAASGYDRVAEELGVRLNYDTGYREVSAPASMTMKRFSVINPALDCDAVVVVSKAKTHSLTYLSGAAKNIFGVIPGLEKPTFHARLPDPGAFGRMIVDLNDVVKPKLQVIDAVMGMEGDGPHTGTPRKIGAVLASGDCHAIDVATCRLMSIDPLRVPTITAAVERGYLHGDLGDVSLTGDNLEDLIVKDFKGPSTYLGQSTNNKARSRLLFRVVYRVANESTPRPVIHAKKCTSCMKCVRSCPVKTIAVVNKKPKIDYKKCIKCYCCHEMCDSHAISLERSLAGKVLARLVTR